MSLDSGLFWEGSTPLSRSTRLFLLLSTPGPDYQMIMLPTFRQASALSSLAQLLVFPAEPSQAPESVLSQFSGCPSVTLIPKIHHHPSVILCQQLAR